jgi:hypothetical protein
MSRWKKLLIGILVLYLGVFVFIGMVIRLALWPSLGPDGAAFMSTCSSPQNLRRRCAP